MNFHFYHQLYFIHFWLNPIQNDEERLKTQKFTLPKNLIFSPLLHLILIEFY